MPGQQLGAGPGPGEQHWFGGRPLAGADLAIVRLRSGALDGARAALEPAFALPAEQRIADLTTRLAQVRTAFPDRLTRVSG
jgi:hypothetical protein